MKQELLNPKAKYIIVNTMNELAQRVLRRMERGRENTIARPEMYPFKTKQRGVIILNLNKFTLFVVARLLKKFPDEINVFVGDNYWLCELPQEIQGYAEYGGNNTQLMKKIKMEEAAVTC